MAMLLGAPDDRRAAHARFRAELAALLGRLTGP
jgi:hypothetical protein